MQIEFQILDALQKIHTPVLDGVMCLITSLGNAGIIWILLTIALLINPKIRRTKDGTACRLFGESGRRSGCILLAALILDLILCNGILKNLFHRVRPYDIRTSIELLVKCCIIFPFYTVPVLSPPGIRHILLQSQPAHRRAHRSDSVHTDTFWKMRSDMQEPMPLSMPFSHRQKKVPPLQ